MFRRSWGALALGAAIVLLAGCSATIGGQPIAAPPPVAPADAPVAASTIAPVPTGGAAARTLRSGAVRATAKVAPVQMADLSFTVGGQVQTVSVKEGDQAAAGAILATLDQTAAQAAAAQAQAALAGAQARLAALKAGPLPQELAAAQAGVDAAQAQLDKLQAGARSEDIAAAEGALAAARAEQQKVQAGPDPNATAIAAADLANAQAAVQQAQAAYDQIKSSANAGMFPQALQLEQSTNALAAAKARFRLASEGPTTADVARARAGVAQAAAALAALQAAPRPADLAAAQAEVHRAQAQFDQLKAGNRPETIAAGESDVAQAQAALSRANADLANTALRAPFAGTVTSLKVNPGETATAGQVLVTVADLSHLWLATTDLSERDVARVAVGQPARMSVEALGKDFTGHVARIAAQASVNGGDTVYAVYINLDTQPQGLRWGMTAIVDIPGP